jgi:hypothetical protein
LPQNLELNTDEMGTTSGKARDLPSIRNFFDALRIAQPIILKSENVSLWDVGTNLDLAREMIRSDSCKRENQREGKLSSPRRGSKKPVNLFQQRGLLHVTPRVASTFEGQFNKTKMVNYIIEDKSVVEVSSRPISILSISVKVKISHNQPELLIINFLAIKPINKLVSSRLPARTINHH